MWNIQFASFIFLLLLSYSVQAQVYKCENDMGAIVFSDEPCAKGEKSERLNWLKNATSGKKKKRSANVILTQAKKTAKKAKKENKAYVLLSLMTTTQLELETASLRSTLNGGTTEIPELLLSDGIIIDFLKVKKIIFKYKPNKGEVQARFIMDDGYEEVKNLKKPFPVINGAAKIGRFSKSLQDIKQIEFFNSKKLLRKRAKKLAKKSVAKKEPTANKEPSAGKEPSAKQKPSAKKASSTKDTPVIELDLSHELANNTGKKTTNTGKKLKMGEKPRIKVVDKNLVKQSTAPAIEIVFVNDKQIIVQKKTLISLKGSQKSRGKNFIVSEKEQIPYESIKRIKVRPTTKDQLIVAIELKTKEIKMQVMLPPFTRIIGKTESGAFDHSLSEIKSISFQ